LLEGECVRIQGDEEFHMKAGDFWQTPGDSVRRGKSTASLVRGLDSRPNSPLHQAL
jgi:hypothetical protein